MSLLHLVHKSVVIKFSESAKGQFKPEASYAFRLTGVDAMGFLQIQDLKPGAQAEHEVSSDPYWINKDLVREIHELDPAKFNDSLQYNGHEPKKAKTGPAAEPSRRLALPKAEKVKPAPKPKPALI